MHLLKVGFVATVKESNGFFLTVTGDSVSCLNIPFSVMLHVCQKYQLENQSNMLAPIMLLPMKDSKHTRHQVFDCRYTSAGVFMCVLCVYMSH